ncbi:hypothetical protein Tco_0685580 [Tanacetum coccineum]
MASPEQTATGKDASNPFMASSMDLTLSGPCLDADFLVADSKYMMVAFGVVFKMLLFNPLVFSTKDLSRNLKLTMSNSSLGEDCKYNFSPGSNMLTPVVVKLVSVMDNRPTISEPLLSAGTFTLPFQEITIPANEETGRAIEKRMQTLTDLTPEENTRMGCDIKAANIILQGLLNDIYTLINHKTKAYGSGIKFEKLMNVINIIGLNMTKLQVDTKFANHLRPEWSKFIIGVKQARNLHEVSFDKLYAYLKQNEADASEVRAMRARFLDPLALVAHTYNSPTSNAGRPSQYNP